MPLQLWRHGEPAQEPAPYHWLAESLSKEPLPAPQPAKEMPALPKAGGLADSYSLANEPLPAIGAEAPAWNPGPPLTAPVEAGQPLASMPQLPLPPAPASTGADAMPPLARSPGSPSGMGSLPGLGGDPHESLSDGIDKLIQALAALPAMMKGERAGPPVREPVLQERAKP